MRPDSKDYSHFKERDTDNTEYVKDLKARIADLNELLAEAPGRNVIVHMTVAQLLKSPVAQLLKSPVDLTPHIHAIIAERI
jgi:hypothetical protein